MSRFGSGGGVTATNPENLTGSRSLGSIYQNTTGSVLRVSVVADHDGAGGGTETGSLSAEVNDVSSFPGNDREVDHWKDNGMFKNDQWSVNALVPDGHYYTISAYVDMVLMRWHEQEIA